MSEPRGGLRTADDLKTKVKVALGAVVFIALLLYILYPLVPDEERPIEDQIVPPSRGGEANLIDCFILRDASASPDTARYLEIEQAIFANLHLEAGDRVSYATFGGETRPNPIAPPSRDLASLASQRSLARLPPFATTDFALLFSRLRDTIMRDREANLAVRRPPHADAVVILSDGIPDLTPGREECSSIQGGFTDALTASFRELITGLDPRQEPLFVRLILVGSPPLCAPQIRAEWERRFGGLFRRNTFRVVSASESPDLVRELFDSLRSEPRIFVSLKDLQDDERRRMDRGEEFSLQYSARSLLRGGAVTIKTATVLGKFGDRMVELRRFHVKPSPYTSSTEERGVRIEVASPAAHELLGPPVSGSIYLEPALSPNSLSELKSYELQLGTEGTHRVEVLPPSLPVPHCRAAGLKLDIGRRLRCVLWLPLSIGSVFLLAMVYWLWKPKSTLSQRIEKCLVAPHHEWFWLTVILLVPMATGVIGSSRLVTATMAVALAMAIVLAVLHRTQPSTGLLLMLRAIEFIVLPLLIEGAASRIY